MTFNSKIIRKISLMEFKNLITYKNKIFNNKLQYYRNKFNNYKLIKKI